MVTRPADRTVFAEIAREAANHPERVALIARQGEPAERSMTYAELVDAAWQDAGRLVDLGIKPGATVGLLCENQPDWLRAYLALSAADARTVALPHDLDEQDLKAALADTLPVALLASSETMARLSATLRTALAEANVKLCEFASL